MTRAPALFACLALAAGCAKDRLGSKGCREDADCGSPASAFRCEPQTGVCFCRTDEGCPVTQRCNLAGFCQDRVGCATNADCLASGLFCDTSTGACLPAGRCSLDLHCPLGQVCDLARRACVPGCHTHGDCPGTSCRCGDGGCACPGTTPEALAACPLGVCDGSFCADKSFCRYGELCGVVPDSGTALAQCYSDFDPVFRPYCARCTSGAGVTTCGAGPNFCIIDTRTASTYCGADCSEGQLCPRGYQCRDIRVVLSRWQCGAGQPCTGNLNLPCATDADCKRGGSCLVPLGATTGYCAGQCRLREGSSFGYCSCQEDADCVQQQCSAGECSIDRRLCATDADCRVIHCAEFDGVGACVIGQNCTPEAGLTCVEVL